MGNTPICKITSTGIYKPPFSDALSYFTSGFQAIYGADIYIPDDSQDGQFIGLLALALDDCNSQAVAAYNSFSPTTALGTGLSSLVKLNGLARAVPSASTAQIVNVGVFGTTINNGVVQDINGNNWDLDPFTIPISGQITVSATCETIGSINAGIGTITNIQNPSYGWQSATNLIAAIPGQPVEQDGQLRARQAVSTQIPSQSNKQAIVGAILAVPNVIGCIPFENDTDLVDSNGIPAHCISLVVTGGDQTAIATAIQVYKAPGCGTFGSTAVVLNDAQGVPHVYNFFYPTQISITAVITIKALNGFTSDIQTQMVNNFISWVNSNPIGNTLTIPSSYLPLQLYGGVGYNTYEIVSVAMARDGNTPTVNDIKFSFHEQSYTQLSYINVIVQT